ncbi:hypothetical protein ACFWGC_04625 [Cytobacillus pseudoceanisediminis]|jgi:hypothetical protein|uniref:hypothetical protein n=1 Tax=Cytobacillus pseudoceanisediminis TaxID=3051614 RepID=UPI0002E65DAB
MVAFQAAGCPILWTLVDAHENFSRKTEDNRDILILSAILLGLSAKKHKYP